MSGARRQWHVSRSGVLVGAAGGVALTLVFVTVVASALAPVLALMPEYVAYGLMMLLVGCFRAVAGMWASMRHRRTHEVGSRTEFFATAALAGLAGWLVWTLLVGLSAQATGEGWLTVRGLLEAPRWVAEYAVGALLVAPHLPEPVGRAVRAPGGRVTARR